MPKPIGKKISRLTILEKSNKKHIDGTFLYRCKCDCGKECFKLLREIKKGNIKSCGCMKDTSKSPDYLIEKKFGDYRIISFVGKKSTGNFFLCECEICGYKRTIAARYLKKSLKCNCRRAEDLIDENFGRLTVLKRIKKKNRNSPTWECRCTCGKITIAVSEDLKFGKVKSCGCLVSETGRINVKHAIKQQKNIYGTNITRILINKRLLKNNTSGTTGVYMQKKSKKWIANIQLRKKNIYLGCYSDKRDAIKARKEAEKRYFKPIIDKYAKGDR